MAFVATAKTCSLSPPKASVRWLSILRLFDLVCQLMCEVLEYMIAHLVMI